MKQRNRDNLHAQKHKAYERLCERVERNSTAKAVEIARVTATGSSTVVEQAARGRLKSEENKRADEKRNH